MGIYEYQCADGHVTEKFVPLSERPDSIPCEHVWIDGAVPSQCKEIAEFVVSATPTTFRQMDRKAFKRSGR